MIVCKVTLDQIVNRWWHLQKGKYGLGYVVFVQISPSWLLVEVRHPLLIEKEDMMREADRQDGLAIWCCGPVEIHDWLRNAEIREISSVSRKVSEEDLLKCLRPLEARRELRLL